MEPAKRPIWLPDTQGFLAVAIIAVIALIVFILLVKPPVIDERTSGVLMTLVGVLIACLKDVYSFFFGSSKGSQSKDEAQAKIVENLTTPTVSAVAATPWWSAFTPTEKTYVTSAAANDPRVEAFMKTAATGHGTADDLKYLVSKGLLTQVRADQISVS